jgi:hypothetical protein
MRKCKFETEQEKCPEYTVKKETPPANLTCLWFVKHFLDDHNGSICTAPPKEKT